MSRRRFPLLAATLAFPLLAAATCGDNLPGMTVGDYLEARERAGCERLVRCGVFTSVDDCLAYGPFARTTELQAAVEAGAVDFRAVRAAECLDTVAAASCDLTTRDGRDPLSCYQLFTGSAEVGEVCALDDECQSSRCMLQGCVAGTCCMGTCLPKAALTENCTIDDNCTSGSVCGINQMCSERAPDGGPCFRDAQCDFGTACTAVTLDPGTCRELPHVGERCPYQRCGDLGTRCANGMCVADGPGSTCTSDANCSIYGECHPDTGTCGALPGLGEDCLGRCLAGAFCDQSAPPYKCKAPLETGAPCLADDQCASAFCSEGPFFDLCAERTGCFTRQ